MEEYSREELLNRLKELVNESEFISKGVITTWEYLKNIEDLKKLLVLTNDTLEEEKKLNEEEKNNLTNNIISINKKQIEKYKKIDKEIRENAEKTEKDKEKIEETLLNI